jgi:WD40 repeat protein
LLLRITEDSGHFEVWDLVSGECLSHFQMGGPFEWLVTASAAARVVVGDQEGMLVFDGAVGKPVRRIDGLPARGYPLGPFPVAITPDGRKILSAGEKGTMDFWDVASGRKDRTILAHPGETAPHLREWKKRAAEDVARGRNHDVYTTAAPPEVMALAVSPDGDSVASGGADGRVKIWSTATGEEVACFPGHLNTVLSVAFCPDGTRLLSGGSDPVLRVWKRPTRAQHP